jgi:drug/metabolite transporter (DMT)-like permease
MIWMAVCAVFSAAFGHVMRYGQARGRSMPWVGAWNYCFAALGCWVIFGAMQPAAPLRGDAALLGSLTGVCFVAAYFLMEGCIRAAGVGITQTVNRLSVAIPVAASMLVWAETPSVAQRCGIALALAAFPFLAYGRALPVEPNHPGKIAWLALCFLVQGLAGLFMKAYSHRAPDAEMQFLCFLFSAAAVVCVAVAMTTSRPRRPELAHGLALGATNVLSNLGLLYALAVRPGTVVFPTTSAAAILLSAAGAAVLWRERYRGVALIGLVLAAMALVLVNLGKL